MTVAETPSAVFHYKGSNLDEPVASRNMDAILRAAKKDLLTLMELDVSGLPHPHTCRFLDGGAPCLSTAGCCDDL